MRRRRRRGAHGGSSACLPGPRGPWLGGNLQAFDQDRLGFLLGARRDFGDLVRFDSRTTIVNDLDLARTILRGPDRRFQITENFVQHKLSLDEIDVILAGRALLNPGLRRSAVVGIVPLVAASLADALSSTDGRPTNPVELLEGVTSQAVAAYYFGTEGRDLPPRCARLLDALAEVIGNPFALPAVWRTRVRRDIDRLHSDLNRRVTALIARRVNAPARYVDGAAVVAQGVSRSANPPSLRRTADLVVGAMLAAHRVPAASAAWLLMELAGHPLELAALRCEVDACRDADGGLDLIRAAALPRVRACVLENLRLHPPTWLLSRQAGCEVTLGGWRFRRGHRFVVSPYVLGRDPRLFEDPESFRPNRWVDGRVAHTSLAFGHGPHGCPGSHFATQLLATAVVVVAARFEFERSPGHVTPDARTTLLPRGLRLTFAPASAPAGSTPLSA